MPRPLEGILVLALEQAVAAPYSTANLVDAGARVIKVERKEGDFARYYDQAGGSDSAYFAWINRGKESLTADIKNPDDVGLLQRIAAKADVFIQNLAPGAAERAGLGSDYLRKLNHRLITCDISGYREDGPCKDMKAYDFLIQCETGLPSINGVEAAPGRVGISICDIATGVNAHTAILEALLQRARTGEGVSIKVSMFDALAYWMTVPLLIYEHTGKMPPRPGLHHPSIAPYGAYSCKDDQKIVLAIQNGREWANLCQGVLEKPGLIVDSRFADNPLRVKNRRELDKEILAVFAQLTQAQVIERCQKFAVAFSRLNDLAGLAQHPELRRVYQPLAEGGINIPAPAPTFNNKSITPAVLPQIGQHDAAIRKEFDADQT